MHINNTNTADSNPGNVLCFRLLSSGCSYSVLHGVRLGVSWQMFAQCTVMTQTAPACRAASNQWEQYIIPKFHVPSTGTILEGDSFLQLEGACTFLRECWCQQSALFDVQSSCIWLHQLCCFFALPLILLHLPLHFTALDCWYTGCCGRLRVMLLH